VLLVGLVAFMGLSTIVGFFISEREQARLLDYRYVTGDVRTLQQALVDAETGVRGFVLTNSYDYLEPYVSGQHAINSLSATLLPTIDRYATQLPATHGEANPVSRRIADLQAAWQSAVSLTTSGQAGQAQATLLERRAKPLMDELRDFIGSYVGQRRAEAEATDRRIDTDQYLMLLINAFGALIAIIGMSYAFWRSTRDSQARQEAMAASTEARGQIEELFGMTNLLQSAIDRDDANEVFRATGVRLLPGISGVLYVFNNSRDRLDLSTAWGNVDEDTLAQYIAPTACWALKRGKPYTNLDKPWALRCAHATAHTVSLEIPMAARGEVYGLLELYAEGDDAAARLERAQPVAMALADAISLSLSGIALREKLHNQALRDPLTGLYNRRFLEEMLERLAQEAERRKTPVAAIMIDLDHFKRLNDQFGHAAGDGVLREVATAILSVLRGMDIACRYGGEELAILLADCSLEQATAKAEQIRARISEISEPQGPSVTASFGVAAMPETTARVADLLAAADAALYQAKHEGRNCVIAAAVRPAATTISLVGTPKPATEF
jgi:diguanylate cyclase (GGDEF)-like protein